jgi:hypothetical protein
MINIGNYKKVELVAPITPSCIEEAIDVEDCQKILKITDNLSLHTFEPEKHGKFQGSYVPYDDETAWIYGRMYDLALKINEEMYKFSSLDMVEHMWYYEFSAEDYLDWHCDIATGIPFSGRKLVTVLNLSSSDEYRGGQLVVNNGELLTTPRSLGTVTSFPGYVVNSVEKVNSGTKKILVAWFGGENFH